MEMALGPDDDGLLIAALGQHRTVVLLLLNELPLKILNCLFKFSQRASLANSSCGYSYIIAHAHMPKSKK